MPNWCSTDYRFYADTEKGKAQLKEFVKALEVAISPNKFRVLHSDFGDSWLGNVILCICPQFLKITEMSVTCDYNGASVSFRGSIISLYYYAEFDTLSIQTETAWEPMYEMWDMILAVCHYTDVKYVYEAEEPAMGLYINTDTEGKFFCDRYCIEIYISDDFYGFETVYLSNDNELLEFENQFIVRLREEYKRHPDRYKLPDGYTTKGLRRQKTLKGAYSAIMNNLFSSKGEASYFNLYEYTN